MKQGLPELALRRAYWTMFEMSMYARDGQAIPLAVVKSRWAALHAAEAGRGPAFVARVYAEAKAAWRAEHQRCPIGGEPLPCHDSCCGKERGQ